MHNCIFCKIVSHDIPSYKVYENDETLAFLDINPVQPGHTLVIPKRHAGNLFEISPDDWTAVQETVWRVARGIERALAPLGLNLMMNNREHAGQVVDHAHVHLIPRYKGDGLKLWPHGTLADADDTAQKIRDAVVE